VKEVSQRTKEQKTKGRMRIRRKRWRTGLVSAGRGDWRRRPIPRVTKKYRGNRKRMRTEDERGNRWETRDIENSGEINGRKSGILQRRTTRKTMRKRQRDEKPKDTGQKGMTRNG
jgi:hypothetical protein